MRIRLHNSLGKFDNEFLDPAFLFDDKIFIYKSENCLFLKHCIDDSFYYLSFSTDTNEFKEGYGFGECTKTDDTVFFKDPEWHWKEMR